MRGNRVTPAYLRQQSMGFLVDLYTRCSSVFASKESSPFMVRSARRVMALTRNELKQRNLPVEYLDYPADEIQAEIEALEAQIKPEHESVISAEGVVSK